MRQVVIILAIQHSRPKVHLGLTTNDLDFALASFDSTSQSAPSCKIMCFCSWIAGEKPCAIPNETLLRVIYLSFCLSFHSNFFFPWLNSSTRSCFRAQVAQDHQAGHWPRVVRVCMVLMLMVVRNFWWQWWLKDLWELLCLLECVLHDLWRSKAFHCPGDYNNNSNLLSVGPPKSHWSESNWIWAVLTEVMLIDSLSQPCFDLRKT